MRKHTSQGGYVIKFNHPLLSRINFVCRVPLLAMAQQTGAATTTTTTDQSATNDGSTSPLTFTLKMGEEDEGGAGGE